jgi:hypothetical protein
MQKCKIFEAKNEKELEKEYNEWADKMSALTEVSHMNTFMKDGWYKMVLLYR